MLPFCLQPGKGIRMTRRRGDQRVHRSLARCFATLALWSASLSGAVAADGPVEIVVLKEHGVGSAAQAQPYLDRFVALAAQLNGWPAAKGRYFINRKVTEESIQATKPHYGIFSLAAFLALREKYDLQVVGNVDVWRAGGMQYHIISKSADDLRACKGKSLASDHIDDKAFIEKVVAGKAFVLDDFQLVPTTRPLQTIKAVLADEAKCALIDDAQMDELGHIAHGDDAKTVWSSNELPPMVLAAFPTASTKERDAFRASMGKLCEGEGKTACSEVGILSLKPATEKDYAGVIAEYGR